MKAIALAIVMVAVVACGTYLQMHDKLTTGVLVGLGLIALFAALTLEGQP